MWTTHPSFMTLISDTWNTSFTGPPMHILQNKLKLVKSRLKQWNKHVFGNINQRVAEAQDTLARLEYQVQNNWSQDKEAEWKKAKIDLHSELAREESFYREKARIRWSAEGDRNTKFYQAIIRDRRKKSK